MRSPKDGEVWILFRSRCLSLITAEDGYDGEFVEDADLAVLWNEDGYDGEFVEFADFKTAGGKELSEHELLKPLHVKRTKVIEILKVRLAEKVKAREDAEKAVADQRSEVTKAIKALSDDELTNIVRLFFCGHDKSVAEALEKGKKDKTWVSSEAKPFPIEDTLEKSIRVYEAASDVDIEVRPSDSIYNLM